MINSKEEFADPRGRGEFLFKWVEPTSSGYKPRIPSLVNKNEPDLNYGGFTFNILRVVLKITTFGHDAPRT